MPKRTTPDGPDLFFSTVAELSARLRQHEIRPHDLADLFSARLEQLGPTYNALALSLRKDALKSSKDVNGDMKRERHRSVTQGIPFAVKDLLSVAGYPTTWGAKPYANQVFDYDATVVANLKKKGALLIGKLSMIELAGGGGYNSASASLQGPGLNPWNRQYWSGGSSSGSGAAVAAGLVPYALGSETSGSILTPAAYCGVTGLRPTYGLVSRHGAMALSWTLDKIGILARSADCCGHVLNDIAGPDDQDPASAGKKFYYAPQYARRIPDLAFGFASVDFNDNLDEQYRPVFSKALDVIKSLGAQMLETKTPDLPYGPAIGTIIDSEAASIFESLIRSGSVDQLADTQQINGLKASLNYSAVDYLKAMRIRRQVMQAFRDIFTKVDMLVAPTQNSIADRADIPFDEQHPRPAVALPDRPRGVRAGLVQASNLAGIPALSLPCGFVNGLPLGIQLVGPAFSESMLLHIGQEFQKQTDFHRQRPPGV
jgi:aspartyl-tRNA(Asn)/glutamyl-tRNA(Gln) amidotransferase subunit A